MNGSREGVVSIESGTAEYEQFFVDGLARPTIRRTSVPTGNHIYSYVESISALCAELSFEQRRDMLHLNAKGYITLPDGLNEKYPDVWKYFLTLTPEQFRLYYISISKKRETQLGVREVLEFTL